MAKPCDGGLLSWSTRKKCGHECTSCLFTPQWSASGNTYTVRDVYGGPVEYICAKCWVPYWKHQKSAVCRCLACTEGIQQGVQEIKAFMELIYGEDGDTGRHQPGLFTATNSGTQPRNWGYNNAASSNRANQANQVPPPVKAAPAAPLPVQAVPPGLDKSEFAFSIVVDIINKQSELMEKLMENQNKQSEKMDQMIQVMREQSDNAEVQAKSMMRAMRHQAHRNGGCSSGSTPPQSRPTTLHMDDEFNVVEINAEIDAVEHSTITESLDGPDVPP